MTWLNNNRVLVAVLVVLVIVFLGSPPAPEQAYAALGALVGLASLAFYSLVALWFWRELNKKASPAKPSL